MQGSQTLADRVMKLPKEVRAMIANFAITAAKRGRIEALLQRLYLEHAHKKLMNRQRKYIMKEQLRLFSDDIEEALLKAKAAHNYYHDAKDLHKMMLCLGVILRRAQCRTSTSGS